MKIKTIAYALLVTVGLASCTAESSAPNTIENATFSLEKKFNARSVVFEENGKNDLNLNELDPVNIDEANTILNTLRNHTDLKEECSLKETAGAFSRFTITRASPEGTYSAVLPIYPKAVTL